jgi:glutathione S-transferase
VRRDVAARMASVDARLAGKDWALGRFSVADCYMYVFFAWATYLGFDTKAWPNYARHFERMNARPAVQRMQAREKEAQGKLDAA